VITDAPPVSSVFFGGGTPTLLESDQLVSILTEISANFGVAADAEVTSEANPESVDERYLAAMRGAGFNRISLGMQSASADVLSVLDRQHTPGRSLGAVADARAAGFHDISLDLIYGTPGESDADWRHTLMAALSAQPTHVSAYSLIVEPNTRLARDVATKRIPVPDEDVMADRYRQTDKVLREAGFAWYEVSNWALRSEDAAYVCEHNLGYWHGDDWLGVGPGAHSHVNGVRWSNVKYPARYAAMMATGAAPVADCEVLTAQDRELERLMLAIRLKEGIARHTLSLRQVTMCDRLVTDGFISSPDWARGRLVLTLDGRLLADGILRELSE
jgi:oxygen-independent coproporphyrinogen-3 oxidase